MRAICIFVLLACCVQGQAFAQPADQKIQQLIDDLKQLTDQAERDRSANYRLIDQLRDLTARYDRPWRKRILFDDFSDGELQRNPAWHSNSQDFWVTRSIGLRSQLTHTPQQQQQTGKPQRTEEVLLGILLDGVMQNQNTRPQTRQQTRRPQTASRADISTAASIDNAFAIAIELSVLGRDRSGSYEWGPYQGKNMESGYRLVYQSGSRPSLKLLAYRRGMTSVVDQFEQGQLLEDGNSHHIGWQRTADGFMTVLVDNKVVMQVRDRSYRDRFSGFVMTNRGGEYGIRSVSIFTAR
ncbi:hypothetical protein MMIC_P1402 [Mariprofundus micogutta]|uniref:Uncharacterized protein n=1 Tax=Mariprofundus micogutta TaxID=1921010 RepID=A0A1L8CNF9_9PROT|nr:hypothetical protein [Mariprofundus micogutta]GAV20437.1 hypothetical protein MMIC_P1402 [Mariprofundus micogutta]